MDMAPRVLFRESPGSLILSLLDKTSSLTDIFLSESELGVPIRYTKLRFRANSSDVGGNNSVILTFLILFWSKHGDRDDFFADYGAILWIFSDIFANGA
jgi:hypothetical protein